MEVARIRFDILFLAMLACGILSVFFGKELCWDLANYHFYNPYALLHDRYNIDYWPASYIHQYINPTIDLLTWFLIQTFTPRMSEFILGAISGVNLWLLFLISKYFLKKEMFSLSLALVFAFVGLCGPTTLPGIGSFQNDNLICIFVLGFVLLQLHERIFLAGCLLGLGLGLKLTAGIYAVGAVAACLFLPGDFKLKFKSLMIMGMGVFIGMMVTSGYWMWMMYQQHQNPFYPFFSFSSEGWRDTRFMPKDIWQMIFYPFYFSWDGRIADAPFRDFRFVVVYVLFAGYGLRALKQEIPRWKTLGMTVFRRPETTWLFVFFISSYIIWQLYFSIARYLAPLEMLTPIVIYLLLNELIKNATLRFTVLFSIFTGILLTLSPIAMIRAPWYEKSFFNVNMPEIVENTPQATVLMAYSAYVLNVNPRPQSYLIPFFPAKWSFIGIPLMNEKYMLDANTKTTIEAKLQHSSQPIFILAAERNIKELINAANSLGYALNGQCEKITSDRQAITHQDVLLCSVRSRRVIPENAPQLLLKGDL